MRALGVRARAQLRKRVLDVDGLFSMDPAGPYFYQGGYNRAALVAFAAGVLPNVPGFLQVAGFLTGVPPVFVQVYNYAWFVGFGLSGALYVLLMRGSRSLAAAPA